MYKNLLFLFRIFGLCLLVMICHVSNIAYADQCYTKHIARIITDGKFFSNGENGQYFFFIIKNEILGTIKIVANKNEILKQYKKIPKNGDLFEVTFDQTQLRCQNMNLIVNFLISLNTVNTSQYIGSMDKKTRKHVSPQQMEQLKELKEALNFIRD